MPDPQDNQPTRADPERAPLPGLATERFSDGLRSALPDADFDQFEGAIADWHERFRRAQSMATYEERRFRETGLITARRQIGHLAAGTAIRLVDLASGLIVLFNTRHAHAAYAVARAILETAAVPAYANRNLVPLLVKGKTERADEVLRRLTLGVDPGIVVERETPIHPIRISKLIDALCSEFDDPRAADDDAEPPGLTMRRLYSDLTDHSHPNYSAVHLSSTIGEEGMTWARGSQWTRETLDAIEGPSYLALALGGRSMDAVLAAANKHHVVLIDKNAP